MTGIKGVILCTIVSCAMFIGALGDDDKSYLLKIDLPKRDAIYDLVGLKVSILQELPSYIIAEIEEDYLDNLKKEGYNYEILDENPKENLYYLVSALTRDDFQVLQNYGKILCYEENVAILKITVENIEGLFTHEFMVKELRKNPVRLRKKSSVEHEALFMTMQVNPLIADMVALVSQGDITGYIQSLEAFTTRYSYTSGCENAAVYIYGQFDSMGLDVEYQDFGNNMADNVIATQYGVVDQSKIYIICAHYDSTSDDPWNNAPGADDNASGSAAVLEVASVLSQYKFNYTIKYICFSGEEQGLIGSNYYAAEAAANGDNIAGVINLDMIGYVDIPVEDLEIIGNPGSEWLVDKMVQAAQGFTTLNTVKIIDSSIIWSDHSPFWDEGMSALCGIEDFWPTNPNYHEIQDTLSTLSLDFAADVTQLAVATMAELAQPYSCGIVLLFDTSGSMSWRHDGTTNVPIDEQRLTLAKEASYPFLEMLNDYNSGKANFGIATFPAHPASYCTAQIVTPMTLITNSSKNTAISTTIPGLTTEDSTPLIAGLETAMDMFGWETNKVIVLLSDGYHNCPSFVEAGDEDFVDLITELNARAVKVYTIGFARPGDVDGHFLDELAAETDGAFRDVTGAPGFDPSIWHPATDLQGTYKAILADGLSLETPTDPLGVITAGETILHKSIINEHDQKISFFLSWVTPQRGRLGITVKASDDNILPMTESGISFHEGKTYIIITVDKSFLKRPGKVGPEPWKIMISGSMVGGNEKEHYQYSVIADSKLKMRAELDKASYQTGNIVTLTARLTEDNKPITGLDNVKVVVTRPEDGFGNWFAMNKVSAEELEQISIKRGDENLSPVLRKAIFLTDVRNVAVPTRTEPFTLSLYDDATHGDVSANDGIYTNHFTDTVKEGTYSFYFKADGPTMAGNTFAREVLIQKYITVNINTENTEVNVVPLPSVEDKMKTFKIIITPKDSLGNYLGPRYSGMIRLSTSRGRFVDVLHDTLDGSYNQVLQLDGSEDVKDVDITINIRDVSLSFNLPEKIKTPCNVSFYLGRAFPTGNYNKNYDPSLDLGLSVACHIASHLWAEGLIGYNHFNSGATFVSDTYWLNISANLKYEFTSSPLRLYVNSGPGIYIPKKGSTSLGINIGIGTVIPLSRLFSIESRYNHHSIFTGGNMTYFSTVWLGFMFSF